MSTDLHEVFSICSPWYYNNLCQARWLQVIPENEFLKSSADSHASHPVFLTSLPATLPTRAGGPSKAEWWHFSTRTVTVKSVRAHYIVGWHCHFHFFFAPASYFRWRGGCDVLTYAAQSIYLFQFRFELEHCTGPADPTHGPPKSFSVDSGLTVQAQVGLGPGLGWGPCIEGPKRGLQTHAHVMHCMVLGTLCRDEMTKCRYHPPLSVQSPALLELQSFRQSFRGKHALKYEGGLW